MSNQLYVFQVRGFYDRQANVPDWDLIVITENDIIARKLATEAQKKQPETCEVKVLWTVDLIQRGK